MKAKQASSTKPSSSRRDSDAPQDDVGEVQEVTAHLTVPHEGGWGWVVVACAFSSIFILDGVAYTFGSLLGDIAKDFQVRDSLVALINSTAVALYFTASPMASALINKFGFRMCAMSGSIICSFSLFISYFTRKYVSLFLCYGLVTGFGYSLINMSSSLVVGFHFERLRSVALAIATTGSSLGVMTLFPTNTILVQLGGWRTTTLLHSGLFGIIFFLGMAYRPVLTLAVTKAEEDASFRPLAYLPSTTSQISSKLQQRNKQSKQTLTPSATERLFSAVSNINFPTAAKVLKEVSDFSLGTSTSVMQAGPSKMQSKARLLLTPQTADGSMSEKQSRKVHSVLSRQSQPGTIELRIDSSKPPQKVSFWKRIFHWDPHVPEFRPMYRDDVFYEGKIESLPAYQKSLADTRAEDRTGLEYQMAVTRTTAVKDLEERSGLLTTAVRRVLATMMDPSLLKKPSFLLMCGSGFCTYLGFLVPYVYLQDRNLKAGIDPFHCRLFISAIGLSNALGRLILGSIASKIDPIMLFSFWCTCAGIATILSSLSFELYYQYTYCCVFGFSIASVACLRSLILVKLYGLEKLTNATGMMLIFLGIGNLLSTPLAGLLKNNFGYGVAFYVAGGFMTVSGMILIFVKIFSLKELRQETV